MFRDFSAVEPYERRFERMGFANVRTGGVGTHSISMDIEWPDYVGLEKRNVGNSAIIGEDGNLSQYTLRLPGFPREDYDRSLPDSIVNEAASAIGMDADRWKVLNEWGPFYAYHIKYRPGDSPRFDMDDMARMTKAAKDRIDSQFTEEVRGFV